MKPTTNEHPEFYGRYISHVRENTITEAIAETSKKFLTLLRSIDPKLENYAYAKGKWTIKEVVLHCSDTERIFCTRALGYARGETQKSLPFDENTYAQNSDAGPRSLKNIIDEYESVANATMTLFSSFSEEVLAKLGQTPSGPSTVNAVGYSICGHNLHHMNVLVERYLNKNL